MTSILKSMHSPKNFALPATFVPGMERSQYAMSGGRDRVSMSSSQQMDENSPTLSNYKRS